MSLEFLHKSGFGSEIGPWRATVLGTDWDLFYADMSPCYDPSQNAKYLLLTVLTSAVKLRRFR